MKDKEEADQGRSLIHAFTGIDVLGELLDRGSRRRYSRLVNCEGKQIGVSISQHEPTEHRI